MKMVYCTCNVSVLDKLLELVEENNIREYQVIDRVTAKTKRGQPRFNDPVWPGYNAAVIMQVAEDEKVKQLIENIKSFNHDAFNENELVTVCAWNLEHYFFD